jgi:hypothetical protein
MICVMLIIYFFSVYRNCVCSLNHVMVSYGNKCRVLHSNVLHVIAVFNLWLLGKLKTLKFLGHCGNSKFLSQYMVIHKVQGTITVCKIHQKNMKYH